MGNVTLMKNILSLDNNPKIYKSRFIGFNYIDQLVIPVSIGIICMLVLMLTEGIDSNYILSWNCHAVICVI